jgi:hypothetical protein
VGVIYIYIYIYIYICIYIYIYIYIRFIICYRRSVDSQKYVCIMFQHCMVLCADMFADVLADAIVCS